MATSAVLPTERRATSFTQLSESLNRSASLEAADCLEWLDRLAKSAGCGELGKQKTALASDVAKSITDFAFNRGLEKEVQRVERASCNLAQTPHPTSFGSAVTHPFITLDFCESQVEFITPTSTGSPATVLSSLSDLCQWAAAHLPDEEMWWTGSMPPPGSTADKVPIAYFGSSHAAQFSQTYRRGLEVRYGKPMQAISGIHYNISLPTPFWHGLRLWDDFRFRACSYDSESTEDCCSLGSSQDDGASPAATTDYISQKLMGSVRNLLRHAWLGVYLFGAAPAADISFPGGSLSLLEEDVSESTLFLPWATSLRVSDVGYTSKVQAALGISYNSLQDFTKGVKDAVETSQAEYESKEFDAEGNRQQLSTNVLQIENELYAAVRPKSAPSGKPASWLAALMLQGVQYVEIRTLDVNPLLEEGVDQEQLQFFDILFLYSVISQSPAFTPLEQSTCAARTNLVAKEGRRPDLHLPHVSAAAVGVVGGRSLSCGETSCDTPSWASEQTSTFFESDNLAAAASFQKEDLVDNDGIKCCSLGDAEHLVLIGKEQKVVEVSLEVLGKTTLANMRPVGEWLDRRQHSTVASECALSYCEVLDRQVRKLEDATLTPSHRVLEATRAAGGYTHLNRELAKRHTDSLKRSGTLLGKEVDQKLIDIAVQSHEARRLLEEADEASGVSFEAWLADLKVRKAAVLS